MSKNKHRHASTVAASSAPITEPTQQPTQEKTMEASQQNTTVTAETPQPSVQEASALTAKQMALAEEENAARALKLAQAQNAEVVESVPLVKAMASGIDGLHEQFRRHNEAQAKKKEYTPPPRTQAQMDRLNEELQAGAKRVAENAARQAARPPMEAPDLNKEGFTTPVYRPNDTVPDPMLTGTGKAGAKGFSPDA